MKRSNKSTPKPTQKPDFPQEVKIKSTRKLKARQQENRSIWFSFGMIGVVGWSVAIPMLLGIALGIWIDSRWPSRYSWTLMMLFVGIILGCLNAWYWVQQESRND